jgi:hypothetical protein
MSVIRIRKRLDSPIPGLPELAPLIGKTVRIVAVEDPDQDTGAAAGDEFWESPTADELAAAQGVTAIHSIDQLRSPGLKDAFEGFDEALRNWRNEPWRGEDRV